MTGIDDPRLTAYAVDEGDEETAAAVAASEQLQDEVEEIRDAARLLAEALAAEPAPALLTEGRDAIVTAVGATRGRRRPFVRWSAGLAAAAALVIGVSVYQNAPVEMPPVQEPSLGMSPSFSLPLPGAAPPIPAVGASTAGKSRPVRDPKPAGPVVVANEGQGTLNGNAVDLKTRVEAERRAREEIVRLEQAMKQSEARVPAPALSPRGAEVREINIQAAPDQYAANGGLPGGVVGGCLGCFGRVPVDTYRRPSDPPNREAYTYRADNDFLGVTQNPLSTFSIDVDTASYANVRRFLNDGQLPPPDAVRIEEMVNYFPYDYAPPTKDEPFAAHIEVATAPWNTAHRLVRIGLNTRELDKRPDSNLVFLVDVSGSMKPANKLPLVKQALRLLVDQLTKRDRVAMVVYAGSAGEVLPPTRGDERATIFEAIDRLESGGSTNGGEGIELAYDLAARNFIRGGANRVILATDGDFNVGTTDEGSLVRLVEQKAKTGVFLSVFGFGMGNYQDSRLEALADKGNGNYGYIDTVHEARKALVEQMNATLVTVAKDVKIQVEFNPAKVQSYRLIGYENRMLRAEDFKDDTKDAGEVGAGHSVTVLYELVPAGRGKPERDVDPLAYQKQGGLTEAAKGGELLWLKVRYKDPEGQVSRPKEWPVSDRETKLDATSPDFRFAAAVAAFGMILRNSPHKGEASLDEVLKLAEAGRGSDRHGYRAELITLVHKAQGLSRGE
jgi:Ca-activated chloride channel homolog